jgi:hypothetical protein
MMLTPLKGVLLTTAAVFLAACGQAPDASGPPTLVEPQFGQVPAECSTASMANLARAYLSNPEQQAATENLRAMATACANDPESAVPFGWTVLGLIEDGVEAGTVGDPETGAMLATLLIEYICEMSACTDSPMPVGGAALGPQGIFAMRAGGTDFVVAHGAVQFTDFDDREDNEALWGLETNTDWEHATGEPNILFYGAPTGIGGVLPDELSFGDLVLGLNRFPSEALLSDGELSVGVCYLYEVTLDASLTSRLQRNGTLLVPYEPDCDAWWATLSTQTAGLSGALHRIGDLAAWALLPRPLAAYWAGAPASGGSPIDFSDFAPVAADPDGTLAFVTPPVDGRVGEELDVIRVQALSGLGTPMERVLIELYVAGNSGEPGGATFCNPVGPNEPDCDATAYTMESPSGYDTLAEFADSKLWKAGGYTICARALTSPGQPDFTFAEACAPMIHIKN